MQDLGDFDHIEQHEKLVILINDSCAMDIMHMSM